MLGRVVGGNTIPPNPPPAPPTVHWTYARACARPPPSLLRAFRGSPQYSCPFVSISGSGFFRAFRVFRGCSPQYSCPLVSIRGSEFFRVFRSFRGLIHSCPFVVQHPPRTLFVSIRVFRGSLQYSCPLVSIRGSELFSCLSCFSWYNPFVSIRVHSWFRVFSCFSWFNPFVPIRGPI